MSCSFRSVLRYFVLPLMFCMLMLARDRVLLFVRSDVLIAFSFGFVLCVSSEGVLFPSCVLVCEDLGVQVVVCFVFVTICVLDDVWAVRVCSWVTVCLEVGCLG